LCRDLPPENRFFMKPGEVVLLIENNRLEWLAAGSG
jgi:hypothetical protein